MTIESKPAFFIQDVPIAGELILAPLSGYNDQPFRRLCREFGAALVYTGLLSAKAICKGTRRSRAMLRMHPDEHPIACQLYGNDPEVLVAAARIVAPLGPEVLDLNFGCAKPKVTRGGYGAILMQDPRKIARIITQLVHTVSIPITAKIRLGWEENRNYLEVARVIEECGAALLAVHGRTSGESYDVPADWDAIAEVKQALRIPVLASGDVRCVADADRLMAHTGCEGVMIGRAALGNPWIFQRRDRSDVTLVECRAVMARQLRMMLAFHGSEHGLLRFRKHIAQYRGIPGFSKAYRKQLLTCESSDVLFALLS